MKNNILLVLIFILSGCASVKTMDIVKFPDCEVHYVGAEIGIPVVGSLKVIDRYQHTYSNNKTILIRSDASSKDSDPINTIKSLPLTVPVF